MQSSTAVHPTDIIEALARRHQEPTWATDARRSALDAYLASPQPARVSHLWRYTDPALLAPAEGAFRLPQADVPTKAGDFPFPLRSMLSRGELAAAATVGASGHTCVEMPAQYRTQGLEVVDLHAALQGGGDAVRERLAALIPGAVGADGTGKLEALNLALWSAGTYVRVPRNVAVPRPIYLWHTAPRSNTDNFLATRTLIHVGEGAEVTIIDECEGGSPRLKLNGAVEIFAERGAQVRYVFVQRLESGVAFHAAQRCRVERDARVLTCFASLGAGVTKADFGSILDGPGANVELFGFLFGEGRQHFDHHTVHDHRSGRSYSNLDFKVVLKDRARSAYTGLIRIEPGCPDSEAYQENRNLLLSGDARAESIPELEILTDEVRCTHGATMGTLDAQQVFYLMSRGIERAEAIQLIVGGFIEPTLSRLGGLGLDERLRELVEERMRSL